MLDHGGSLAGEAGGKVLAQPFAHQSLGDGKRLRRDLRQALRQSFDPGVECGGLERAVGQPPRGGLLAGEPLPAQDQPGGALAPHEPGQALGASAAWHLVVVRVVVADPGVRADDREVARLHELETTGHRVALDGGHYHRRQGLDPSQRAAEDLEQLAQVIRVLAPDPLEVAEVPARAEVAARAADDDDAAVGAELGQGGVELRGQLEVHGIHRLWPRERDPADAAVPLGDHGGGARGSHHAPRNSACRFSRKASTPSWKSAVVACSCWSPGSSSSWARRPASAPASSARLMLP